MKKIKDTKDVNCLCIDNGLFTELALRLARDFKKVYYCVPGWINGFPKMNEVKVGYGFPEIEVVESPFGKHYDDIDLFFFPDCYFGEMQVWLEKQGKAVWGSRMGEEMELSREGMKRHMEQLGLPVAPWVTIKGMDNLRAYLKENPDKWVKISKWRGLMESFYSKNYKQVEPKLDEVEFQLGAFKYITEFVVENNLKDKVEIGLDGYTIDGKFPSKLLAGIEVKDKGYVSIFTDYDKLPKEITGFDQAITPTLQQYGYRGFYSTELRVGKDKVPYMIDFCGRAGSPPNELYQEFYLNLPEIIWSGANGIMVDPEPVAKYGAELLIHSSWADKNWQPISFPKENRKNIKLRNCAFINNNYYVIPQAVGLPEVGAAIGYGDTLQQAVDMAKKMAESVEGYYIDIFSDALDAAEEEIEKTEKFGFGYFNEK